MMNPESLSDWLQYIEALHPKGVAGIVLGLERVQGVKATLRQRPFCPVIMVGGTNGKGSTCAYLESIYRHAGYQTGCYTSPHLLHYEERITLNGIPVDAPRLSNAFARVERARQDAGDVFLSYFEFGTLAAWEVFAEVKPDIIILEVGLGGRLDAVNAYDADCSIVTTVSLDHTDWLGETREAIGHEKAGIFRAGRPAICADLDPPLSLVHHAAEIGATLYVWGEDFVANVSDDGAHWVFSGEGGTIPHLPLPALVGDYQRRNAAAAIMAIQTLSGVLPVSPEAFSQGLLNTRLSGRFERIAHSPEIIVDVAHNPEAARSLAENLHKAACAGRTLAVVGMLADKDMQGVLDALVSEVDIFFLASLDVPRGASAEMLKSCLSRENTSFCFENPQSALASAMELMQENDRIIVFGSFYTVSLAISML